jgi:hypothetical protein
MMIPARYLTPQPFSCALPPLVELAEAAKRDARTLTHAIGAGGGVADARGCQAAGLGRERQMVNWSASQEPALQLQQYTHLVGERMAITCRKSSRKARLIDEPIRGVQSG